MQFGGAVQQVCVHPVALDEFSEGRSALLEFGELGVHFAQLLLELGDVEERSAAGVFRQMFIQGSPKEVEAKIADGILTVRLPKAESARPRTVKILASAASPSRARW